MRKKDILIPFLCFFVLSSLTAYYFLFLKQVHLMSFDSHLFSLKLIPFLISICFILFLMTLFWFFYSKWLAGLFQSNIQETRKKDLLSYLPILVFLILPFANQFYMSREDMGKRAGFLGLAILCAFVYLKLVHLYKLSKNRQPVFQKITGKLSELSLKKKIVILFLLALVIYNGGSIALVSKGITFSGDEPHFLLISHSLIKDGDINLSNNYEKKDYETYMPPGTSLVRHTAPGTKGKYSFHSPGFSILMLPFYALASLFKGKMLILILRFSVSLIAALLGIQIFLFSLQAWKNEKNAVLLWALFCFTSPVFFYGFHFYPELLITLLSFYVFRIFRFRPSLSKKCLLGLGFILSIFIWFHAVKYVIITLSLVLYGLWVLKKKHRLKGNVIVFLLFPVVITLSHLLFQYIIYGSFSPSAISHKGQFSSQGFLEFIRSMFVDIPFRYRWETLAGYFLDQKDGFLLYAPIYFFSFLGLITLYKKRREDFFAVLLVIAPYILFSAFLTQRTGYAPQARPVISVFWGFAIMIGAFMAYNSKKIMNVLFGASAFISFLFTFLLVKYPFSLYQMTTFGETERAGSLFLHLSNLHFYLPKFLPSFIKIETNKYLPNLIWPAVILIFICVYLLLKKQEFSLKYSSHVFIAFLGLSIASFLIVLYPRVVLLYPKNVNYPTGEKVVFYSMGRVAQMKEPGKIILPQSDREYVFYFTSWRELKKLNLKFGSEKGKYKTSLSFFDMKLFEGITDKKMETIDFKPLTSYNKKNHYLYRISLTIENKSQVSTSKNPYYLEIIPDI